MATVVFVTGLVWQAAVADVELDRRALEEALAIGQSPIEGVRTRFHEPYRVTVGAPPVDYLDVVTPFRAVVLAAQARARAGDPQFGLRQALETYAQAVDETVVYIELTFHPHNTFVGIPDYGITLEAGSVTFEPVSIGRIPRFGPRVGGYPLPSTPRGKDGPAGPIRPRRPGSDRATGPSLTGSGPASLAGTGCRFPGTA
jgi:hypothetical protein